MTTISSIIIDVETMDIGSDVYNDFIRTLKLFPFVQEVQPNFDTSESAVNFTKGKRHANRMCKKQLEELIKKLEE